VRSEEGEEIILINVDIYAYSTTAQTVSGVSFVNMRPFANSSIVILFVFFVFLFLIFSVFGVHVASKVSRTPNPGTSLPFQFQSQLPLSIPNLFSFFY
jgi:hypothetical protein